MPSKDEVRVLMTELPDWMLGHRLFNALAQETSEEEIRTAIEQSERRFQAATEKKAKKS